MRSVLAAPHVSRSRRLFPRVPRYGDLFHAAVGDVADISAIRRPERPLCVRGVGQRPRVEPVDGSHPITAHDRFAPRRQSSDRRAKRPATVAQESRRTSRRRPGLLQSERVGCANRLGHAASSIFVNEPAKPIAAFHRNRVHAGRPLERRPPIWRCETQAPVSPMPIVMIKEQL